MGLLLYLFAGWVIAMTANARLREREAARMNWLEFCVVAVFWLMLVGDMIGDLVSSKRAEDRAGRGRQ